MPDEEFKAAVLRLLSAIVKMMAQGMDGGDPDEAASEEGRAAARHADAMLGKYRRA